MEQLEVSCKWTEEKRGLLGQRVSVTYRVAKKKCLVNLTMLKPRRRDPLGMEERCEERG